MLLLTLILALVLLLLLLSFQSLLHTSSPTNAFIITPFIVGVAIDVDNWCGSRCNHRMDDTIIIMVVIVEMTCRNL